MQSWFKKDETVTEIQLNDPTLQQTAEEKKTGLFDQLDNREIIIFKMFKIWVKQKDMYNEICDDWYLYRFCVARNFKLDKVQAMFETNYEKNIFYKVSTILEPTYAEVRASMPKSISENLVGIDKLGRPIKVQKYHSWDPKSVKACPLYDWGQYNFRICEQMTNVVFPYCSKLANKRIDKFILIFDLGESDMSPLLKDKELRKYIQIPSEIGQDCYPELVAQLWFINVPTIFSICWMFIKLFMSAKTQEKSRVFGRNQEKKMIEAICKELGKENLPEYQGGEVQNWKTHQMPWSKFMNHCEQKKTFYPNKEKKCSDPLSKAENFDFTKC